MRKVLGSQTDDKSVLAQAILKILKSAGSPEERVELFAIALTEIDSVDKDPKSLPNKGIDDATWEQLTRTHVDIINGHMKMAFSRTSSAKEFATELLRLIDFLEEDNEKTFALAQILFSPYVPYQELPGTPVHMSSAEYGHKLQSDRRRTELVNYIMGLPFDERTERASLLLQILDDTQDNELRVALLAHANYRMEQRVARRVAEQIRR
jgi:hypothetical protein